MSLCDSPAELYERLYFHEIEVREQLNARLQMPLSLLLALGGVFVYLVQSIDRTAHAPAVTLFWGLLVVGTAILTYAAVCFVSSWYNHEYQFLPYAVALQDYCGLLERTYAGRTDKDALVSKYLAQYITKNFVDAATKNGDLNDRRSIGVHQTNGALIASAICAVAAALTFYFGDLDKTGHKQPVTVEINRPVEVRAVPTPATVPAPTASSTSR